MSGFQLHTVCDADICTMILSGEADLAVADQITRQGTSLLRSDATQCLVIDLGGVSFVDSTTLGALIRLRNLAAQEGDPRFRAVRNASLLPITEALAARIAESQAAGRVAPDVSPIAAASAMVAMTERVAAFHREIAELGVTRDALVATTARIIDQTVTGPS